MNNWAELDLTPMLANGMASKRQNRLFPNNMEDVLNYRVTEFGLQPLTQISVITDADFPAYSSPFPNIFMGQEISLVFFKDSVFSIPVTLASSSSTLIPMYAFDTQYPAGSTVSTFTDNTGAVWSFADTNDYWTATNGTYLLLFVDSKLYYTQKKVPASVCSFRGRVYAGGLSGSSTSAFWNSAFISDLEALVSSFYSGVATVGWGANAVFYSCVGGEDYFEHHTSAPDLQKIKDYQDRGESGYSIMPWSGSVMVVKPLGDGVMVYGSNGITFMKQDLSPISMRLVDFKMEGLAKRNLVAGDDSVHFFITPSGSLYSISSDLKVTNMDCEDIINPSGNIVPTTLVYDPHYRDLHMTVGSTGYVITEKGISTTHMIPISAMRASNQLRGFAKDGWAGALTNLAKATTGIIRFPGGRAGTLHGIRLITKDPVAHTVTLYHRRSEAEAWKTMTAVVPDKGGFCDFLITNYEMQVYISTDITGGSSAIEGLILYYDSTQRLGLKGLI